MVSNTDIITAIANDNGYEKIFSNSFDNLHEKDDLLILKDRIYNFSKVEYDLPKVGEKLRRFFEIKK